MQALVYLDKINNTNFHVIHLDDLMHFLSNKKKWKKTIRTDHIEQQIALLKEINQF